MFKALVPLVLALALTLALGCGADDSSTATDDAISDHMVAEATLTAHYVAAALEAGMTQDEINAVLKQIAGDTVISEFWISDENGRIEFSNVPGLDFAFPTDPEGGTQAAPFATLLSGQESVVVQDAQTREADGARFKYVGVAGVDQPRIVQVGLAVSE